MIYFHDSRILDLKTSRMWGHCFSFWLEILPYFCIFLINNYVLSPLLLFKKRHLAYVVSVFVCVVTVLWLFSVLSELWFVYGDPELMFMRRGRFDWDQGMRHPEQLFEDSPPIPVPPFIPFLRFVVAFLIIGFNVAIKLYFKSLQDDRDLMELRHRQLESELRYLKYQVNPHFFMNTLNNIHALVDINAERETAGSGIGLENLRKRLKLHFDNDYVLLIKNEDNCYEVLLIIPFYD